MNREDIRTIGTSLVNLGRTLERNGEVVMNFLNIANTLELIRQETRQTREMVENVQNETREIRNMAENINDNLNTLTDEVRLNERNSIFRVINSHNLNDSCDICWLPVYLFI
jgi:hypothetical protein